MDNSDNNSNIKLLMSDKSKFGDMELFIKENYAINPNDLRLKVNSQKGLSEQEIKLLEFYILQLEARRKFGKKTKGIDKLIYPSMIAGEQASNSEVASFHASLLKEEKSLLDMTAGLGIDFIMMAKRINESGEKCVAIELDAAKAECLSLNLDINNLDKAEVITGDSIEILKKFEKEGMKFDIIFVDPARRDTKGGRLFNPSECSPNVPAYQDLLLKVGNKILVKNSPMLDISRNIEMFKNIANIYIVSKNNECKEILIEISKDATLHNIISVEIKDKDEYIVEEFKSSVIREGYAGLYGEQEDFILSNANRDVWIYEPSASIMKIGCWEALSTRYGVKKCSPNCHIFISDSFIQDFPGRISKLKGIIDKKGQKRLKGEYRNIVTRNYPLKADQLATKLKTIPGSDSYIYGITTGLKETPIILESELYKAKN